MQGVMLKFIHHIQYVVNSQDEFMAYMETNFGLKADDMEDGSKHSLFNIYQT